MFEEIPSSSSQILHIPNFLKGGDFMGIEHDSPERQQAIEDQISRMIWEGSPVEPVSDPKSKNTSFPERNGRIRFNLAPERSKRPDPNLRQPR